MRAKTRLLILCGALLSAVCLAIPSIAAPASARLLDPVVHTAPSAVTVHSGDTLDAIAALLGVTPQQLAGFNRVVDPNLIVVGEELRAPPDGYVAPAPAPTPPSDAPARTSSAPVTLTSTSSPAGHWCFDLPDNTYARYIAAHEAGCNPRAVNPHSGACGIPQFLPCRPYGWDGKAQTDAMIAYVMGRYGSWAAAYSHKIRTGWY